MAEKAIRTKNLMDLTIQNDTSDLWMCHMRNGEFERAWEISDALLESRAGKSCRHLPRHFQYIWNGTPLDGKCVLVRCYHGLGDTIQFIRYAPLVKAVAPKVIIWAQPQIVSLLQTVDGIDHLLPLHTGTPEVDFDVDVEIMELPHIFRTRLATIPSEVPYLRVEPIPSMQDDEQFTVGLVWKAGDWDERRSIPFELLAPLAKIENVKFYILQHEAQKAGWHGDFGIYPGELCLSECARFVRSLDLMISVDSMPAHLAGALGIPVWNLLHAEADWRWMNDRDDSPWYPSMRLFRQKRLGDWKPVVQRVFAELEDYSKRKTH